jgi:hypothetical protein
MTRKADEMELETLKTAIAEHPGERPGFFARLLGWRREKVNRALTSFQDEGILVSEDEAGNLWPVDAD